MTRLARKDYQTETLLLLTEYCREIRRRDALGEASCEAVAFRAVTGRGDYYTAPGFENVPYVCLRLRDQAATWGFAIGAEYGEAFASREPIGLSTLTALM